MIALFIAVILSFTSIVFSSSRRVAIVFMLFVWIMFGWNYSNGDYDAYENIYNASFLSLVDENYEIGFRLLCILANVSGLTFQGFMIVISGLILTLFLRFFLKYSQYPAFVVFIFFWFFFPLDYVLLRNFFAFSIVIQGIICVLDDVPFKHLKFAVFVLLASSIHYSSFFYFILMPFFLIDKPAKFIYIIILVVFGMFLYKVVGQGILLGYMSSGDRSDAYQTNFITFLALFIFQLLGTLFIIYLYRMMRGDEDFQLPHRFYTIFLNINIAIFFITVLYFDFSIFVRLYRNVAVINCVFITNLLFSLSKKNIIKKANMTVLFLCYLVFFFVYFISYVLDDTLISLFRYNRFFA